MTKIAFSSMQIANKIPPGDDIWSTFNASFKNMDLEDVEILNLIYTGHPFTTWHKNNWRHSKNYQLGQHIGLDFDTEDHRSSLVYLAKDHFIQRHANILYTTPSHTPEAPRARVLFLLDTPIMQPQNYALSASALLWLFGTGDRQCKDAARFFYGSINCDVEYIGNVLPLDTLKSVIQQYKATGEATKRNHSQNYSAPADQQQVQSALKCIDPWGIDYDEWVRVLMGIHAEFGSAGMPLAEAWAQGANGEVERKWRSFDQNGNGIGRVTLNSLFKLAIEKGWQSPVAVQ